MTELAITRSAYGNAERPVRIGRVVVGYYQRRGWEPECAITTCPEWGSMLGYFFTRREAEACVREHYRKHHAQ